MYFVKKETNKTLEEKKSKFIAYLCPYANFYLLMEKLKQEHPKARHFVYAYRYLNDFEQIVENCSDDGEPKGTSGKPSLNVLAGNELINSAVIIVRYFGGIKLGTGGLVRAYSDAVNLVIQNSDLLKYEKLIVKNLKCEYPELSQLEYLLNKKNIRISSKEFTSEVNLQIELTKEQFENLKLEIPRSIKVL